MDVTINNELRNGMYDIEEESKKDRKCFDKILITVVSIYESNSVYLGLYINISIDIELKIFYKIPIN